MLLIRQTQQKLFNSYRKKFNKYPWNAPAIDEISFIFEFPWNAPAIDEISWNAPAIDEISWNAPAIDEISFILVQTPEEE